MRSSIRSPIPPPIDLIKQMHALQNP
jgi:hypothetical protein